MKRNIWLDGIMGVLVGDALGMPVQFLDRRDVRKSPITTMRGYGTFNKPPGTWSDDGSMTLATLDSIVQKRYINYDDIMCKFIAWYDNGIPEDWIDAIYDKDSVIDLCQRVRGSFYV